MELNIFKKEKFEIKNIEFIDETDKVDIPKTNLKYKGIEILIGADKEESLKHIEKDWISIIFENNIVTVIACIS